MQSIIKILLTAQFHLPLPNIRPTRASAFQSDERALCAGRLKFRQRLNVSAETANTTNPSGHIPSRNPKTDIPAMQTATAIVIRLDSRWYMKHANVNTAVTNPNTITTSIGGAGD